MHNMFHTSLNLFKNIVKYQYFKFQTLLVIYLDDLKRSNYEQFCSKSEQLLG